jgi:hypothetical protein
VRKRADSAASEEATSPTPSPEKSAAFNLAQKAPAAEASPPAATRRKRRKVLDSSSEDEQPANPKKKAAKTKKQSSSCTPERTREKAKKDDCDNVGASDDSDDDTSHPSKSPKNAVEVAAIVCAAKHAVNDIEPHDPGLPPFMYWKKNGRDCARRLFKRSKTLRRMANHHKDPKHYAHKYADIIRTKANEEMNAQIRVLRELYVCNQFPEFQLVQNCLTADQKSGPMCLSPAMANEFDSVEELKIKLASDNMYTSQLLYDTFCKGIESGKLRECPVRRPTPLQAMCTIAHEAHFRLEVSECMSKQGFRWGLGPANVQVREAAFEGMCERVAADRANHADVAWDIRKTALGPEIKDDDSSSDDDPKSKKGVTVNSKYY